MSLRSAQLRVPTLLVYEGSNFLYDRARHLRFSVRAFELNLVKFWKNILFGINAIIDLW
jgi:hypothetical protein